MSRAERMTAAGYVALAAAALVLLFTRRPDAYTNPQFWAEDGAVWFADAFNRGPWLPFLIPNAGYLQTSSRIGAALALTVPVRWAPAAMNVAALLIQIAPAMVIASSRFASLIPHLRVRLAIAALYLGLPNSWEIHANLTNAQWRVGLLLTMLVIAPPPGSAWGKAADALFGFIAALSGPFGILAMPVVVLRIVARRERSFLPLALATAAGSIIQAAALWTWGAARSGGPLAASVSDGLRIIGGQIGVGGLLGEHVLRRVADQPWSMLVFAAAAVLCLLVAAEVAHGGPTELRWFGIWAASILVAGMLWPAGHGALPAWPFLAQPGNNGRYWFAPTLLFLIGLAWTAVAGRWRCTRLIARAALLLLPIGVIADWRHPPYADLNWPLHAAQVEAAPPGTELVIPINPRGVTMRLLER